MQLTVRDVAELFKVNEKTIYRWIKAGELPAYRFNSTYRFNRAELIEWATARRMNVPASLVQEPKSEDALISLSIALAAGGIHYRITGKDKDALLKSVVDLMRLPEDISREFLLEVLMAREAMASTGVGDGIAIPHIRNPIVLHLPSPLVTLCFTEQPVDFGSLDGKPVTCLFTLVSPTVRTHLSLLSRLAFVLRDADFMAMLRTQAGRDDILGAVKRIEAQLDQKKAQGSIAS
jgi:PTS system nitrogen regulatory IIA component